MPLRAAGLIDALFRVVRVEGVHAGLLKQVHHVELEAQALAFGDCELVRQPQVRLGEERRTTQIFAALYKEGDVPDFLNPRGHRRAAAHREESANIRPPDLTEILYQIR